MAEKDRWELCSGQAGADWPEAAVVTKTYPLYTIITLDAIETNSPSTPTNVAARYVMSVERQAAPPAGPARQAATLCIDR